MARAGRGVLALHRLRQGLARLDRTLAGAQLVLAQGLRASWAARSGWPQDRAELRRAVRPVFVLSPGRSGTMTLARLFDQLPGVEARHEPAPALVASSALAARWQTAAAPGLGLDERFWRDVVGQARDTELFRAHRRGRIWLETNNRLVFLADALRDCYPQARFVAVFRDWEGFVASAMARGYYRGHLWDFARLTPPPGHPEADWFAAASPLLRCTWLWARTTERALSAHRRWGPTVVHPLAFSAMLDRGERGARTRAALFRWVGAGRPSPAALASVLGARLNRQTRRGAGTRPADWSAAERAAAEALVAPVRAQVARLLEP